MANGWTAARRAKQAMAIRRWQPWQKSTGPKTEQGRICSSRNAFKGGQRPLFRAKMREMRQALDVLKFYDRMSCY